MDKNKIYIVMEFASLDLAKFMAQARYTNTEISHSLIRVINNPPLVDAIDSYYFFMGLIVVC